MKFKPITEEEAETQSSGLWQNGDYDYEVREATEKTSANGNEMTELEVWIFDSSGTRKLLFDYLVATERSMFKIRHFAASCGLLPQYERGSLSANEMVGRTGKCTIATQPAKDGYPAKNVIRVYLKAAGSPTARPVTSRAKQREMAPADDLDDSIPF